MNKAYFGTYAALVTPYTHDNKVNYNELQKLVRYLIDNGIDGFYVGGSTAEAFLLSTEERKGCLEAVVEAVNGERNVICHTGSISTDIATELAIHAEKVGANAVSAISPFIINLASKRSFSITRISWIVSISLCSSITFLIFPASLLRKKFLPN